MASQDHLGHRVPKEMRANRGILAPWDFQASRDYLVTRGTQACQALQGFRAQWGSQDCVASQGSQANRENGGRLGRLGSQDQRALLVFLEGLEKMAFRDTRAQQEDQETVAQKANVVTQASPVSVEYRGREAVLETPGHLVQGGLVGLKACLEIQDHRDHLLASPSLASWVMLQPWQKLRRSSGMKF